MKKNDLSPKEIQHYLDFAIKMAKEAGNKLIKFEAKIETLVVKHKKAQGVTSEADLASEKLILSKIKKKFPKHHVLAEESSYKTGEISLEKFKHLDFCWIIDPLDGTNNFLNGLNYYAVCIALAYRGEMLLGVVYRPSTDELFYAAKGVGSFYQKPKKKARQLFCSTNPKKLKDSIVSTGFATEKGQKISSEFKPFENLLTNSRAVRRMGSAALDMCYTASGVFDGFWERHLKPWDVAASGIICLEAGALVTDFKGQSFTPFDKNIIVARKPLYAQIKKFIALS